MWMKRLTDLLSKHAPTRVNGKVASMETQETTRDILFACFRRLEKLGYMMNNPENMGEKHVRALVRHWYFEENKSNKTMQNQLSRLRVYTGWIGKPGLVRGITYYLPEVPPEKLKVQTATRKSKAWISAGIDVQEKIRQADGLDWRFGCMIRIAIAFGLRREELVHCRPHLADRGSHLHVLNGKGGQPRYVPIDTPERRAALDFVKARLKGDEYLGWPYTVRGKHATKEYSITRYNKLMAQIEITKKASGVTGHGARAQYVENISLEAGFVPTVLGGTVHIDEDQLKIKILQISENLGHHRKSVYAAYAGKLSALRSGLLNPEDHQLLIDSALLVLIDQGLSIIGKERMNDVMAVVANLATVGIQITPACAHALWVAHSRRHAVDWVAPTREILPALLAAAKLIVITFASAPKNVGGGE
jgi:integrase